MFRDAFIIWGGKLYPAEQVVKFLWIDTEGKRMKYFEVTATTPYCGEELTGFYAAESEFALRGSGKLDHLIEDCVAKWFDADEYDTYGFDSPEDYEKYYYCGSGVEIREISKEEYDEAIAKGW